MRALAISEIGTVCGGVSDNEANQAIGKVVGDVWHGITSAEGRIGGLFGVGGLIAGVVLHYQLQH